MVRCNIIIGEIYKHYKGGLYQIMSIAKHTESLDRLIIYKCLKSNNVWARPYGNFISNIYIDGYVTRRFIQQNNKDISKII